METTELNIEVHPYEPFVPENATILILGSFPGLMKPDTAEHWFYSAKRNQFWTIIGSVYAAQVTTVEDKKGLFMKEGIAITDIILKTRRKQQSHLDKHLDILEYNMEGIQGILAKESIKKVFFTSRFVESLFRKRFFTDKECECLPSPSPRYVKPLAEKIRIYKQKLATVD